MSERRFSASELVDGVLRLLATALLVSMGYAAWHDASKSWDVWSYHLPFATRIAGMMDAHAYTFGAANQARFEGFPLLAEALQGLLVRITSRPESANLLAFGAVCAFALFLRFWRNVPPYLTWLSLMAVPLVQIHATAAYIDLAANACAAALLLLCYGLIADDETPSLRTVVIAGVLAAFTANMKFQLVPIVLVASLVFVWRALARDDARSRRVLTILAFLPIVFATPIKNLVLHGNPVWPIELRLPGISLPHVEGAYASSPVWLEHASRPVRFLCSVAEIGLRPIASHHRWSLDQWAPHDSPSYRMGGFFGVYVLVNVAALGSALFLRRSRESVVAVVFFAGVTVVTSVLPQSHELRYYLYWMILLVGLNLILWAKAAPRLVGIGSLAALAVVAWSTGGGFLYASGDSFADLVHAKVDSRAWSAIAPRERVCIERTPWTFLYAPAFHPEKAYSVQEAEEPSDCGTARPLD